MGGWGMKIIKEYGEPGREKRKGVIATKAHTTPHTVFTVKMRPMKINFS